MSYSRWEPDSRWYTYWHTSKSYVRDTQLFDVCGVCGVKLFTYQDLKDNLDKCLSLIQELDPKASEEQLQKLKIYMKKFLYDVETDPDIINYEKLQHGIIDKEWIEAIYEEALKEEVNEALTVLKVEDSDVPLLIGNIKTDLGKLLIDKRLRNEIKKS